VQRGGGHVAQHDDGRLEIVEEDGEVLLLGHVAGEGDDVARAPHPLPHQLRVLRRRPLIKCPVVPAHGRQYRPALVAWWCCQSGLQSGLVDPNQNESPF
jgi:hypothetical protein